MRQYQSRGKCVVDELGEEVCRCKDDATAQRIADALNRAEAPGAGSLLIRPHRMEGATVEWPKGSLLDEPAAQDGPLSDLLTNGEEVKLELCGRAGGTLSAHEVAKLLDTSYEAVDKRRCERRLLAVKLDAESRYPACQFSAGGLATGVLEILEILGAEEWTALEFMITPVDELGGETGLQALASSDPAKRERALRLARIAAGEGMG